jgi:hypothetical protein
MFGQYDFQGQINKMNEQILHEKKKEFYLCNHEKKIFFFVVLKRDYFRLS